MSADGTQLQGVDRNISELGSFEMHTVSVADRDEDAQRPMTRVVAVRFPHHASLWTRLTMTTVMTAATVLGRQRGSDHILTVIVRGESTGLKPPFCVDAPYHRDHFHHHLQHHHLHHVRHPRHHHTTPCSTLSSTSCKRLHH